MLCQCRRTPLFSLAMLAAAAAATGFLTAADAAPRQSQQGADAQEKIIRPGSARLAIVSLGDQRVTIYDADGPVTQGPISSGAPPNDTPPGIYAILQKNREHYSNRYDDAAMPFMQRITWTGIALHGGALPGYPASHGCVRLRNDFASQIFGMTKLGMRVIVSRNNVAPSPISHPKLFKPTPFRGDVAVLTPAAITMPTPTPEGKDTRYDGGGPNDPPELAARTAALQAQFAARSAEVAELEARATKARDYAKQKARQSAAAAKSLRGAEQAVKRATDSLAYAERILSRAKKPSAVSKAEAAKEKAEARLADAKAKLEKVQAETQPTLEEANRAEEAAKAAEAEKDAGAAAAREAERKLSPVSVFVSLKTMKLYVRQDFEPVFETDITIRDPDQPIGTHTFTAVDYKPGGREMRWNVVSIAGRQPGEPEKSSGMNRHPRNATVPGIPTDVDAAAAALDRVEIPAETVERISELVLPGSSLIISDEAAHPKETGKATDFVVLLSGEPQGGIILRPKPKPEYYDDEGYYGSPFGWGNFGYSQPQQPRAKRGPYYNKSPFPWW